MTDQIELDDGVTVDVADDPEDASLYATKMTVSASEKTNLGNYQNFEPYASTSMAIRPVLEIPSGDRDKADAVIRGLFAARFEQLRQVLRRQVDQRLDEMAAGQTSETDR